MSANHENQQINKKSLKNHSTSMMRYLKTPWLMGVFLVCMTAYTYTLDMVAGAIMSIASVVYMVISIALYFYNKPRVMEAMVQFAASYSQVQKHLLEDLDLPYGLIDSSGRVLWFNKQLQNLVQGQKIGFRSVTSFFPGITEEICRFEGAQNTLDMTYEGRNYRVELKKVEIEAAFKASKALDVPKDEEYLIALYLFDVTHSKQLEKENFDNRMVAGLIYIDNYEEALQSVEEVRQSLLVALIDRRINKYFAPMDAIVRKLEKDKYFIVIKQKYVSQLQSNKFSVLDEVKSVNIGNEMALTISIGMGICGYDYGKACESASVAIDLALGRGGDQAVIKDGEKIYFYGGKSKQVEKNTRVKARVKAHALRELIETKEKVIIMGHAIGDIDSFGASIGLYRAVKTISKRAYIVLNEVTASLQPMVDCFLNNDDYEEDLFIGNERAVELIDDNTVVIIVDTSRPGYVECPELISKSRATVILDHHRQSGDVIENASLSYIEPYASSTCEMVAEILQYIHDGIRIKPREADAMYGGIMIDTNNFSNKAGVRTFEAAAFLKKNGADVTRVKKMFRDDINDYMAKAEIIRNTNVFDEKYAIGICRTNNVDSPTVVCAQAANELLNIKGIAASFVLADYNGKIYISARSIDEMNVQLVMEKLGGGGHMNVAGAQLENISVEAAAKLVIDTVRQMVQDDEV